VPSVHETLADIAVTFLMFPIRSQCSSAQTHVFCGVEPSGLCWRLAGVSCLSLSCG
jgi:hypothetical protein